MRQDASGPVGLGIKMPTKRREKGDSSPKEERKTRLEMSCEQERAGTAGGRTRAIWPNGAKQFQNKGNNITLYDVPKTMKGSQSAICPFATPIFESRCSEVAIKASRPMSAAVRKEITHHNERNDKTFDIDMNVWKIIRNRVRLVSFHLFHGQSYLTTYAKCSHYSSMSE
jgi:hypothetical protein